MYYSNGIIRPQGYFPDVRSNSFVQVCTNYLITEMIGSAHVEVILCRGSKNKTFEKKGNGVYLVGIPDGVSLIETKLFYWFIAMCIVRYELHGCLFKDEFFGESAIEDVGAFQNAFCQIGNEIIAGSSIEVKEIQQVLFLACPEKGIAINLCLVNAP
jgi:hypothetical protein